MNVADVANALYFLMTLSLAASGVAVVYTALGEFQVVVYRRGVLALGASFLLLVTGWLLADVVFYAVVESWLLLYAAFVAFVAGAAVHLYAVWQFTRDLVDLKEEGASVEVAGEYEGGFETDER